MRSFLLVALVTLSLATVQGQSPTPTWDVVSVRANNTLPAEIRDEPDPPNGLVMIYNSVQDIIGYAYRLRSLRIIDAPGWIATERYDLQARATRPLSDEEKRLATRALLADRFGLRARFEPREQTV